MNFIFVISVLLASFCSAKALFFPIPFLDPCKYECGFQFFGEKESCSYGADKGVCGCCNRCLKGEGQSCGGTGGVNGKCASGFYCDKVRVDGGNTNAVGSCVAWATLLPVECTVPCAGNCPAVSNCPNGIGYDACGCCQVCAGGEGATCDYDRPCGNGYFCSGDAAREGQVGVCRRWNKHYCKSSS